MIKPLFLLKGIFALVLFGEAASALAIHGFRFIPPDGGVVTVPVEALSVTPESVSYTMAMSHERSGGGTLEQAQARAAANFLLAGAALKTTLTIQSQSVLSQPGIVVPGDPREVTLQGVLSQQ